jgi:hypothetical protein
MQKQPKKNTQSVKKKKKQGSIIVGGYSMATNKGGCHKHLIA